MTATEKLRAMLDERGVEWYDYGHENHTWWNDSENVGWHAENRPSVNGLYVKIEAVLTPEQAIAATLGAGTCHDLAETPAFRDKTKFKCSECGYEYSSVGGFGCDYGDEPDFNFCPNCGRKVVDL